MNERAASNKTFLVDTEGDISDVTKYSFGFFFTLADILSSQAHENRVRNPVLGHEDFLGKTPVRVAWGIGERDLDPSSKKQFPFSVSTASC